MTRRLWFLAIALTVLAAPLLARVGGGESYSGGGGSSGGGGGDGGGGEILYLLFRFLFWLTINYPAVGIPVDIIVIIILIRWFSSKGSSSNTRVFSSVAVPPSPHAGSRRDISELRKFDPNFSEVVFTDFCYSLYGRVHHARGQGKLDNFAPYLSPAARASLGRMGAGWVGGIVIGSFKIADVRGLESPNVVVTVDFEANYTEMGAETMKRWYVRERWLLERGRDVLSPTPEHAKAEHCPKCGAALQTRTDGSCGYCGTKITNGGFDWYVRSIETRERSERPPTLLGHAPEQGTDLWTVFQPGLAQKWAAFQQQHTEFDAAAFEQRVRLIASELQAAWTSHEWERARAYETDALFQMHRYWIDEYKRQRLRNVVDGFNVTAVEIAKVSSDAFFDAITVRIHANGRDYTVDESSRVVSGSKTSVRSWTEYWTLIRGRAAKRAITTTRACPNCGAELKVSETGICAYCGGKITSGDFDWVLSRIEQDESYRG